MYLKKNLDKNLDDGRFTVSNENGDDGDGE